MNSDMLLGNKYPPIARQGKRLISSADIGTLISDSNNLITLMNIRTPELVFSNSLDLSPSLQARFLGEHLS